jgi:agmatinase
MQFPDFFADANASLEQADMIIVGVPYDKTTTFRPGAQEGPQAIRRASWNFETFNIKTGVDILDIALHDYGNIDVQDCSPDEMVTRVTRTLSPWVQQRKVPLVLGGEHSLTAGAIKAFSEEVAVLSLDAHLDFRDEYEGERYNHACVIKRISDHIPLEQIAVLGFRSAEKQEFLAAQKEGLFAIDAFQIHEQGIQQVIEETQNYLGNRDIYLTLDIDVVDPGYAPGTSTPEPFGLKPMDVLQCIDQFFPRLVGCDVVEVCPAFDHGQTAMLAAKYVRWLIERIWMGHNL